MLLGLISTDGGLSARLSLRGYRLLRARRLDWDIGDTGHEHRHVIATC